MRIDDEAVPAAEARMSERIERSPRAVSARYEPRRGRIVVRLNTGVELTFPARIAQGLQDATPDQLARIEITPLGDGLHWPDVDADLFVPSLLEGMLGSPAWMASQLGAAGGRMRTPAKAEAARQNGRRGGRPRKSA